MPLGNSNIRQRVMLFMGLVWLIFSIIPSVFAQSISLSAIFWDGANHVVSGNASSSASYGFTFSGPVNFTAFATVSGNFTIPFGGLPEPLPAYTTISVQVTSPVSSNGVSCGTNSQGYCTAEPDGDGDGVPNINDACPAQGSVGYGVSANGCPIVDTDGDGYADNVDACPSQGPSYYGIYANGCPIVDSDSDGLGDNTDLCPSQFGPSSTGGCPTGVAPSGPVSVDPVQNNNTNTTSTIVVPVFTPTPTLPEILPGDPCRVGYKDTVAYIRSEPSQSADNLNNVEIQELFDVVSSTVGDDGLTWYEVNINGITGFVREDAIRVGGQCDSLPKNNVQETISNTLGELGCEPLGVTNTISETQLQFFLNSSDPCALQTSLQMYRTTGIAMLNLDDYTGIVSVFPQLDELAQCAPNIRAYFEQFVTDGKMTDEFTNALKTFVTLIGTENACDYYKDFYNKTLPNVDNSVLEPVLGFCNSKFTAPRIEDIVRNITDIWGIPIGTITGTELCSIAYNAGRIGTPTDTHKTILKKLINECGKSLADSFSLITTYIGQGQLSIDLGADCTKFQEGLVCQTVECVVSRVDIPAELTICLTTPYMIEVINLFTTQHLEKLKTAEIDAKGFSAWDRIANAADICTAVNMYLQYGQTNPPQRPPVPAPSIKDPSPEATETVTPPTVPVVDQQPPLIAYWETLPPASTPVEVSSQTIPTSLPIIQGSGIFSRVIGDKLNAYILDRQAVQEELADIEGSKYNPILFDWQGNPMIAVVVEKPNASIQLILRNQDITNSDLPLTIPDGLTVDKDSRLVFAGGTLYATLMNANGEKSIYAYNFKDLKPTEVAKNASNPSMINDYENVALLYQEGNQIRIWYDGVGVMPDNISQGVGGDCFNPIGYTANQNIIIRFICNAGGVVDVYQLELYTLSPVALGLAPQIEGTIAHIALGFNQEDIIFDNGKQIYLYTLEQGTPVVKPLLTDLTDTLQFYVIR